MQSPEQPAKSIFPPQQISSLREQVYEHLRDAILSGKLTTGTRIIERDIAAQMQISTTPVKEALRKLEQDGLVVTMPRRGTMVSELALTSIAEVVEIRAMLDGMAARLAAAKITDVQARELADQVAKMRSLTNVMKLEDLRNANTDFHTSIRQIGGNQILLKFVEQLRPFDQRVRLEALYHPEEAQRGLAEHEAIYEALTQHDSARAEELMRTHIMRTARFVFEQAVRRKPEDESRSSSDPGA
jgi:DNA-binding GntR family transcriptional regulator